MHLQNICDKCFIRPTPVLILVIFCLITGNVHTVYCAVSTEQDQRLKTGLGLRDRNATTRRRNGRALMILVLKVQE